MESKEIGRFVQMQYNTRLSHWLVEWLRAQDRPATELIEEALIEMYRLKPPRQGGSE